jgi:hypothetical protein
MACAHHRGNPKPPNKVVHRDDGVSVIVLERKDGSAVPCYVDTADYPLVAGYRWHVVINRTTTRLYAGTNRTTKNPHQRAAPKMHQILTGGKGWDHKDRNGLNNRRENLRPANNTQQNANKGLRADNHSGYRGVSIHQPTGKWMARVQRGGKPHYFGLFTTAEEAAKVAASARKKLFGEFAV